MATWNLLADLCFSDLLLYVPVDRLAADGGQGPDTIRRHGQMRPTTNATLFEIDLVGQVVTASELPACRGGPAGGQDHQRGAGQCGGRRSSPHRCIPVRYSGRLLGVMCRVWAPSMQRRRGSSSASPGPVRAFLGHGARRLVPLRRRRAPVEHTPRVGDGVFVLDGLGRITYSSPNTVSALHRVGIVSAINGSTLSALGLDTSAIRESFAKRLPDHRGDRAPLRHHLAAAVHPSLGRRRGDRRPCSHPGRDRRAPADRLLLTKDATIREVHHRVKNNLQTISSLLRLQARRIDVPEGRIALAEAERRIRAIAVVHEILSREASDQVPFDEIVHALVRMVQESDEEGNPFAVRVDGQLGDIPAEMATPLAVVVAELLQNAVTHAFPANKALRAGERRRVDLYFTDGGARYEVSVHDNGIGLPTGFDIDRTRSLGLSIVRDLVRTQLGGTITMADDLGTVVRLSLPARARRGGG